MIFLMIIQTLMRPDRGDEHKFYVSVVDLNGHEYSFKTQPAIHNVSDALQEGACFNNICSIHFILIYKVQRMTLSLKIS